MVVIDNDMKKCVIVQINRAPASSGNMWRSILALVCCSGLIGCATDNEHSRPNRTVYPEDTPERVSLTPAEVKAAITPADAYYLSVRDRKRCAKRAAQGDIVAAKRLARFYFIHHEGPRRTKRDDEEADYWNGVVAQLEKNAKESKSRTVR